MAYNKVVYDGNTLIDLTSDTVIASKLMKGYTAHDKSGALITGTYEGTTGVEQNWVFVDISGNIYTETVIVKDPTA